jgi:hypothetical protein
MGLDYTGGEIDPVIVVPCVHVCRVLQGWHPTRDHKNEANELLLPILVSVGELLVACSYGG